MAEEKTYVFGNDSANSLPLAYALNGNGWNNGGYGLGGWGGGIVGFLLGLAFGGFGNGFGGFGGFGGNGLGGLVNSDSNRDVVLQAINGTDADVRQLASTLGMNYETISQGITDARLALANVGSQVGMSGLQIQNAILSGDASIVAKLQECCCENRLLTTEQGYQAQIRTIEQTNTLGSQADRNTAALTSAINAFHNDMTREFCEVREREMSNKIDTLTAANTALRNQIDNANQTAAVAAMLAPIQKEVSDIRAAQPATTTVTYPQLTAVPSYMLYGNGSYYGGYPYFYGGNGSIWA
jgi:hypothetical protein